MPSRLSPIIESSMPTPAPTRHSARGSGGRCTEVTASAAVIQATRWVTSEIVFGCTLRGMCPSSGWQNQSIR